MRFLLCHLKFAFSKTCWGGCWGEQEPSPALNHWKLPIPNRVWSLWWQIWLRLIHNRWGLRKVSWGPGATSYWNSVGSKLLWVELLARCLVWAPVDVIPRHRRHVMLTWVDPGGSSVSDSQSTLCPWADNLRCHSNEGWVSFGLWLTFHRHCSSRSASLWPPAPQTSFLITVLLPPFNWGISARLGAVDLRSLALMLCIFLLALSPPQAFEIQKGLFFYSDLTNLPRNHHVPPDHSPWSSLNGHTKEYQE